WLDHLLGLKGIKTRALMLRTPDGETTIELVTYYSPASPAAQLPLANTLGIVHLAFVVDDLVAIVAKLKQRGTELFSEPYSYEGVYKLCYVRGPAGIILELAEEIS